jgi:hypothetical protein
MYELEHIDWVAAWLVPQKVLQSVGALVNLSGLARRPGRPSSSKPQRSISPAHWCSPKMSSRQQLSRIASAVGLGACVRRRGPTRSRREAVRTVSLVRVRSPQLVARG